MELFPARLKCLRQQRNLTQAELSQAIGITQGLLSHYEAGQKEPRLTALIKIADYFHVSIDYLAGRTKQLDIFAFDEDQGKM